MVPVSIFPAGSQRVALEWATQGTGPVEGACSWGSAYPFIREWMKDCPIIAISDVKYVEKLITSDTKPYLRKDRLATEHWVCRRYQTAWHTTPRLEEAELQPPYISHIRGNHLQPRWTRYITIGGLVDFILQSPKRVKWANQFCPKNPFQLIGLNVFEIIKDPSIDFPVYIPELVDDNPSCSLYHDCTMPVEEGLPLCTHHMTIVEKFVFDALTTAEDLVYRRRTADEITYLAGDEDWTPREQMPTEAIRQLRQFHLWADNYKVWLIDTEFWPIRNPYSTLFSEFGVREVGGKTIIDTLVDYGGQDTVMLFDELAWHDIAWYNSSAFQSTFRRQYQAPMTHGMWFNAMGRELLSQWFTPRHL